MKAVWSILLIALAGCEPSGKDCRENNLDACTTYQINEMTLRYLDDANRNLEKAVADSKAAEENWKVAAKNWKQAADNYGKAAR